MGLIPEMHVEKITDINPEYLKSKGIKAVFVDLDNTLLGLDGKIISGIEAWKKRLEDLEIKTIILTNSINSKRIKQITELLDVSCIRFACKPTSFGFNKAKKNLNVENREIAIIGDQLYTDILLAKKHKVFGILVNPMKLENNLFMQIIRRRQYQIQKLPINLSLEANIKESEVSEEIQNIQNIEDVESFNNEKSSISTEEQKGDTIKIPKIAFKKNILKPDAKSKGRFNKEKFNTSKIKIISDKSDYM